MSEARNASGSDGSVLSLADELTLSMTTMQPAWLVEMAMSDAKFAHELRATGTKSLLPLARRSMRSCARKADDLIHVLQILDRKVQP